MPYKPDGESVEGPRGPHLALFTDDGWIAIPEGATLWIIEDGTRADKIYPLQLVKVGATKLGFSMLDSKGAVMEYNFKLTSGRPKNKPAVEKAVRLARARY